MGDVNTSDSSSQDDQNREQSNSQLDNSDLHNDPAVLKLVDSFASEADDPDLQVIEIGKDEVPSRKEDEPNAEGEPSSEEKSEEGKESDGTEGDDESPAPKTDDPAPTEDKPKAKVNDPELEEEEDDDSYPEDEEINGYTQNSQKRIRQLVAARKRSEEQLSDFEADADYKRQLDNTLSELGTKPEAWDNWVQLGFLLQKGEAAVPGILRNMADNLETDAGGAPTRPPAATPAADAPLDADLKGYVDSLEMSEEAAAAVQATRKPAPAAAPQQDQGGHSIGPRLSDSDADYGQRSIAAVNDEMAKKYPSEWEKLVPEIEKEMAKYAGASPRQWGRIARDAAEKVIRRHKGNVSSDPDPTLRGGGKGPKKQVTALDSKDDFVDSMLDGSLFSS